MYDEISTEGVDHRVPRSPEPPRTDPFSRFTKIVAGVLVIQEQEIKSTRPMVLMFRGTLAQESHLAFESLENQLIPLGCRVQLTTNEEGEHIILVLEGQFQTTPRPWWPNLVLAILTLLSVMATGAMHEVETLDEIFGIGILKGIPFALALMLILGAHELGHYFAARYHNVSVTLPYFLPFPSLFGTLGAFIQLREPMRNRDQLFDIGVAGPLAGLVFAVPIVLYGVATSDVTRLPTREDCRADETQCAYTLEGNSLFYAGTKYAFHGEWLPNEREDIFINQLAFAGWIGLFITGLNLLPLGQLDGGHIIYTLLGRTARRLYYPVIGMMLLLTLNNPGWLLMVLLLAFFGRNHATPLDDITPLSPGRRALGYIALIIFVLIFVPSPIQIITVA